MGRSNFANMTTCLALNYSASSAGCAQIYQLIDESSKGLSNHCLFTIYVGRQT